MQKNAKENIINKILNYKGFHKPYFKCLNCGKMTRIMEDYCTHCDSEVHKTQEEYHEKRSAKLLTIVLQEYQGVIRK